MTRNVAEAAKGSTEITQNIAGVAEATQGTSSSAQESQKAVNELAEMAARLRSLVDQFKVNQDASESRDAGKTADSGAWQLTPEGQAHFARRTSDGSKSFTSGGQNGEQPSPFQLRAAAAVIFSSCAGGQASLTESIAA